MNDRTKNEKFLPDSQPSVATGVPDTKFVWGLAADTKEWRWVRRKGREDQWQRVKLGVLIYIF